MDKRYQIFISSTFSDLKEERNKVMQTIMSLDCIPAGMELFPAMDEEQFEFIKRVIDDCDYYLLIVGARYGSMDENGVSYTEKEYDYAVSKGIPVIAFLHHDISSLPINKADLDAELRKKLEAFRKKVETGRLVQYWKNADDLNAKVAVSLPKTIKMFPRIGWVRANLQSNAESLQEMNNLRKELAELRLYKENVEKAKEKDDIETGSKLATLDDEIILRQDISGQIWKVGNNWKNLFVRLAPELMNYPSDLLAKRKVNEILRSLNTDKSRIPNEHDEDTVKIHLMALGLISVDYTKTTKGGMGLFWGLTKKGKQTMFELVSVKRS